MTSVSAALPAPRRRKPRRAMRMAMSVLAVIWTIGCVFALIQVFSAVRVRCAGCPECLGTAP